VVITENFNAVKVCCETVILSKRTALNTETIKRLIKQKKLKKNSSKRPSHFPAKHNGIISNPHGKTTKTNQENKQWHFSGQKVRNVKFIPK
jgi:hypothetical protein